MELIDVLEVAREALLVMLRIGAPIMIISLAVGLIVSLFQALTQIQEMTLAFVPKILVVFVSMLLFMPFMAQEMIDFMERLSDRIIALGVPPL